MRQRFRGCLLMAGTPLGRAKEKKDEKFMGWKYLIEAQQHASHPMLVELKLEKETLIRAMNQGDAVDPIDEDDGEAKAAPEKMVWATETERRPTVVAGECSP
ncbi:hypothetical protein B0J15DRAFT_467482 [Fusarium solani]|uniref:Uncharacterized protein n=1 Tax=Fusarium solani TaxID=169388 RepID=A0A9P9H4Q5_FUSSL|nr:uncharacterized protein B0J15DRAFT_467482 [Fusarium solani]KAH7250611.1 hypothetical protein B0J15DRAFT_467482 [Fusarium solani]